jgi:hypothetical protein
MGTSPHAHAHTLSHWGFGDGGRGRGAKSTNSPPLRGLPGSRSDHWGVPTARTSHKAVQQSLGLKLVWTWVQLLEYSGATGKGVCNVTHAHTHAHARTHTHTHIIPTGIPKATSKGAAVHHHLTAGSKEEQLARGSALQHGVAPLPLPRTHSNKSTHVD